MLNKLRSKMSKRTPESDSSSDESESKSPSGKKSVPNHKTEAEGDIPYKSSLAKSCPEVPEASKVVHKAKDRVLPVFEADKDKDKWREPFYFIQGADTQLGLVDNYGDGNSGEKYPKIIWEEELILCKKSVDIINRLNPKPKFFIICGDLVDAFQYWPNIRRAQIDDFMRIYQHLDPSIPLVCVCGNHDVGNVPSKESIETYRNDFGDDYFSFWIQGVCFIVINSQLYEDSSLVPEYAKRHEKWLDAQMAQAKKKGAKHTLVFQHIPWFLEKADEKKEYFNIEPKTRRRMLDKFKKGGVTKIFCGHYHQNAGGWDGDDLEVIVTTAIGCQIGPHQSGMRVVKVKENEVKHEFFPLASFPEEVDLNE